MNKARLIKSTDYGIEKHGYNSAVTTTETVWTSGSVFPWASVGTNAATTIVSGDAADAAAGTGLRTVQVEGLVNTTINGRTGGQIVKETATLDGTTAVTLTNEFSFVYLITGLTAGSGGKNAGAISVKHGATTIAHILAGANKSEMAVMIVPSFTSEGAVIHGAWLTGADARLLGDLTDIAQISILTASDSTFGVCKRGSIVTSGPLCCDSRVPPYLGHGYKIEVQAAPAAGSLAIEAGFGLIYDVG